MEEIRGWKKESYCLIPTELGCSCKNMAETQEYLNF
jgi:hypothetical protein